MRNNRLVFALAPILMAACSESESPGETLDGASTGSGTVSGQPATGASSNGAPVDSSGMPMSPGPGTVSPGNSSASTPSGSTPVDVGATTSGMSSTAPEVTASATAGSTTEPEGSGGSMPEGSGGNGGSTPEGSGGDGGSTPGSAGSGGTGEVPIGPMICPYTPPADPESFPMGWTAGEVTVFNDNGGWTWYNDERVVVDVEAGKIVISSAASSASSQTANTSIDAVIHDLATGTNDKMSLGSLSYSDDHNNGGIVIKAPGEYFVAWAHHNVDCNTYWRNYGDGAWGDQVTYPWGQGCPWGTRPDNITYNNPWKMSSEGRYYNLIRSVNTSPNFLYSEDEGQNWTYGGRLTASPQQGYNAGYYKYWGNGVDRIDFFATEAHPRDANTSVFHGYIKGGKSYDSFDNELDGELFDTEAPQITDFTTVFRAGDSVGGVSVRRLWNFDIARYDDGTIGVLWQGRERECADKNNCNPGHHVLYSRFDGTEWKSTYLVQGGRTLYREQGANVEWWEEDYLGGAALDPDDPHVIYVSTNIDPRDNSTAYTNNEIWKGVSCDDGATFQWSPVTMNSPNENLRPVVPKWNAQNSAVLWFRGNYQTAQKYDAEVVGIISTRE